MKQITKRLAALVMCVVMICTLMPWLSFSANAYIYNGMVGAQVRYILDPENKQLVIIGTGEMTNYSSNMDDLPGYAIGNVVSGSVQTSAATSFNQIWFGEGITKIGSKAIPDSCSRVSTVVIGSTVKSYACDFSSSNIKRIVCYSPDLVFNYASINRDAIIRGYPGSTAEQYANKNGIDFYPFENGGGNCYATGSSLRWDLDISELSLTISGTGDMIDYDAFYLVPWVERSSQITSIYLSDEMTHIGNNAFNYCPYFTQISIPESVASIGQYAFAHCTGLSDITIPLAVDSIGKGAFEGSDISDIFIFSENCNIYDERTTLGNPEVAVIHGYGYSSAKSYAEKYGYTFIPIECEEGRHNYKANEVPAACLSNGYTEHTCEYCGNYYVTDEVDALGHDLSEWTTKVAATCTEDGEKERFCSRCDYSEKEIIVASGHAFGGWVNDPPATCTEDGKKVRTCSTCGTSEEVILTAPGHSYGDWITDSEVSCTADGYRYRVCSVCSDIDEETTSAYGHSFSEWQVEKEASCTEDGLSVRVCATCNAREENVIPALGHDYSAAVFDATCTENGYTTHTCNRCRDSYIDSIVAALGHKYEDRTVEATCLEGGYTEHICSVCNDTYIDAATPALGHNYITTIVEATCLEGGYTEHTCSACNDTYRDSEVSALGHDYEVVTIAPTCTSEGFTTHTCRRCSDSFVDENKEALGHDWDNGEIRIPASVFADGLKVYTCKRCGITRDEVLPKLTVCDGGDGCPTEEYTDVPKPSNWAHAGIDFCVREGLMGSTSTKALTFEPNIPTSRSMIVSILYRLEGSPAVSYKATFTDVPAGKWFTNGVIWASENSVVSGYGNGKFGPNDNITREQLASILMRYTNFKGYKANTLAELTKFSDAAKIGSWASLSVKWAVGAGIVSGKASGSKTLMDPQGNATRAEVASILMRYIGQLDKMQTLNNPSTCGHNWVVNTSKGATCEKAGSVTYYCTECASAKTDTVKALGHDDVMIDSLAPTCTEAGWNQWKCNRCGRTYKDPKPALGHDDVKTVVAATCTIGGYEQFTCNRCGRSYKQNQTPALGHSFSNGFCIRCGIADPNNPTPSELTAEQVYAKCAPAVFSIYTYDKNAYPIGQGSGFFVSSTGYAVTNSHVVEDAYFVRAVLSDGREIFAEELVVGNYYEDWALLKFPGSGYPFLTMGSSSTIVGGATVYAIGSPEGLSNSISSGIISNPNRYIYSDYDVIQITTAISPGSSGGALLNKYGQVIGITSGNLDVSGNDLYYAVPIKYFRDELIANGISVPRYVGIIAEIA